MKKLLHLCMMGALATGVFGLTHANVAAIDVGDSNSNQSFTEIEYDDELGGWELGSEEERINVTIVPSAGLWNKVLAGSPQAVIGDEFTLIEHLVVGGEKWIDWTERFFTEGWQWVDGTIMSDGMEIAGLTVDIVPPSGEDAFNEINFTFDELEVGTEIDVIKTMRWAGIPNQDVFPGGEVDIQIQEFPEESPGEPIVPEPATLSLLAVGGGLMGVVRRRRRS